VQPHAPGRRRSLADARTHTPARRQTAEREDRENFLAQAQKHGSACRVLYRVPRSLPTNARRADMDTATALRQYNPLHGLIRHSGKLKLLDKLLGAHRPAGRPAAAPTDHAAAQSD
jgi:hypothetical protein